MGFFFFFQIEMRFLEDGGFESWTFSLATSRNVNYVTKLLNNRNKNLLHHDLDCRKEVVENFSKQAIHHGTRII